MPGREPRRVTEKQRFWLEHLEAWGRTDHSLAGYASTHDLDRKHLYNWKTRLRKLGLLGFPAAEGSSQRPSPDRGRRPVQGGAPKTPVHFSEVRLASSKGQEPSFRIRFPNGVILETTSPDCSMPDRDLVSYLAALP
jgi:hypothetical protein